MELFSELSVLVVLATAVALVMRVLRQPLIIGHILTGLIAGPFVLNLIHSEQTLALLGQIGVAILLFTVGLHLDPAIIKKFGRVSLIAGLGQVIITSLIGYWVCVALGLPLLPAIYVSIALAFSSTIIIMKLISDKGDLETLYAKIAIGFLLVQDLIAVILLFGIPLLATEASLVSVGKLFILGITLIAAIMLAAQFILPRVSSAIARSHEFLFLFALAWGIGIAALFHEIGFSLESGALIAGVALATMPARLEISARLSPLRDFFIVIFFIYLGAELQLGSIGELIVPALILSALVLIGNPLILMGILGAMGYKKKTSLQTGFTVAQISEFSLILVALGVSLGHLSQEYLSLVTLVGLITIFGSTYLVLYSNTIYKALAPLLSFFERSDAREPRMRLKHYEIILFGSNRVGHDFLSVLEKFDRPFVVIDHDPDRIAELENRGIPALFGDAGDPDFLATLDFSRVELVLSTVPDKDVNSLLNQTVRAEAPEAVVIVVAHGVSDAIGHYEGGVDYVVLPHFLGSKHAAEIVLRFKSNRDKYESLRSEHLEDLLLRVSAGHEHPKQ